MTPVLLADVTDGEFHPYRGRAPAQAVILRELIDARRVPLDRLIHCIWGDDPDGGPLLAHRIVHLHVFHLRKRLRPGWRIRNVHGQAYELVYHPPFEPALRKAA